MQITPQANIVHAHQNPFAGVDLDTVEQIIVPRFDVDDLVQKIRQAESLVVAFEGKKGRGKTTHLALLHQKLPECPFFKLNSDANVQSILSHPSPIVLIDSIHHLSLSERLAVYKAKKVVILSRHWRRGWEYRLAKKQVHRIPFKGISLSVLKSIVEKRLAGTSRSNMMLDDTTLNKLIAKHGDHYRGIINELFDQFQTR
ncbi:MAG: hypothetical protein AB8F95_17495 [Bacteroidia bacterium]